VKASEKIKTRFQAFFAGGVPDGITEGDRPGMFVRKDAMEEAVAEGLKEQGNHGTAVVRVDREE
jgi:hypothetical protein